ncbi:MAG: primosomal protein N' [Candidatus Zixiibacteriota bacterium]
MTSPPASDRLVDIVFPRPLPRAFTYRVPAEWADVVKPGSRVRAPLGGASEIGIVIGESPRGGDRPAGIRPISGLVDPDVPVPADIMETTRWVADYYLCSWGEALTPALSVSGGDATLEVRRKVPEWNDAKSAPRLTPTQKRILDAVSHRPSVRFSTLQRLGIGRATLAAAIRQLTERGLVEAHWKTAPPPVPNEAVINGVNPGMEALVPSDLQQLFSGDRAGLPGLPWISQAAEIRHGRKILRDLMLNDVLDWEPCPAPRPHSSATQGEPGSDAFDPGQRQADSRLETLISGLKFSTVLLWGPTGSGKTAVYCAAIRKAWRKGKTALLLVPEISLAGPMVQRLRLTLGEPIGVWHSGLTTAQRYWMARRVARGRYRLVVGARSAVFAPLANLGLIIVDEEHADAYKQSDPAPRYHARDVAVVRARLNNAVCLLGSATPSCETFHNATSGKYELLRLTQRVSGRSMPLVRLIDLTHRRLTTEDTWITPELRDSILRTIHAGRKVIIFLNRRGYATMVACNDCGHFEACPDCGLTLTFHRADQSYRCHLCQFHKPALDRCPKCGGSDFLLRGVGTQKIEELLSGMDPAIRLARLDADVAARRGMAESILSSFTSGQINLLLGTQMVAKGLDVPGVGLVGVIWADQQMAFPDFRAEERTFQLLTQVAGRAGRDASSEGVAEVVVQTFRPEHDLIELAAAQNAELFFSRELPRRASLKYPPFSRLLLLSFSAESPAPAFNAAGEFAATFRQAVSKGRKRMGQLLGPAPAAVPRRGGRHVVHVLIKCDSLKAVRDAIHEFRRARDADLRKAGVALVADVDPVDFW